MIKKHEKTRARQGGRPHAPHRSTVGAQTGPVFLTYRASAAIDAVVAARDGGAAAVRLHGARRRPARRLEGDRRRTRRRSSAASPRSRRSTSPTAITARRARRARAQDLRCQGNAAGDGGGNWFARGGVPRQPGRRSSPTTASSRTWRATRPRRSSARVRQRLRRRRDGRPVPSRKGLVVDVPGRAAGTRSSSRPRPGRRRRRSRALDVSVLQDRLLAAAARHRRPAHRQAHRFRRRHPRHRPSSSGWWTPARGRRGVLDVPGRAWPI